MTDDVCSWTLCDFVLTFYELLEKVLLDPIFMISKCELFTPLDRVFETSRRFNVSTTRSLGHVMFSFAGTAQENIT